MDQYPQQTPPPNFPQPGYPNQPMQPGFTPPGYPPQQPGFVTYPAQPPRKSRTGLWVGIIAIVLLLGAGSGVAYFVIQGQGSPTATLQKFCDGYKNLNAQEVYDTLSTGLQAQPNNSKANIEKGFGVAQTTGAKISDCAVSNVHQNGSTATATITITATLLGVSHSSSGNVSLVQENGQWKIDQLGSLQ